MALHPPQNLSLDLFRESKKESQRRINLVEHAFQSSAWGPGENLIVAHGVLGWIEEINGIADRVSAKFNGYVDAFDTFEGVDRSILQSLRLQPVEHRRAPPTMHSRVRLYFDWPHDWPESPEFMMIASERLPVIPVQRTVLVGKFETLRELAFRDSLNYFIIGWWKDHIAVRAYS